MDSSDNLQVDNAYHFENNQQAILPQFHHENFEELSQSIINKDQDTLLGNDAVHDHRLLLSSTFCQNLNQSIIHQQSDPFLFNETVEDIMDIFPPESNLLGENTLWSIENKDGILRIGPGETLVFYNEEKIGSLEEISIKVTKYWKKSTNNAKVVRVLQHYGFKYSRQ